MNAFMLEERQPVAADGFESALVQVVLGAKRESCARSVGASRAQPPTPTLTREPRPVDEEH
jgi:hypothetical protein